MGDGGATPTERNPRSKLQSPRLRPAKSLRRASRARQPPVEVEGGADERQVGEGLREVAEVLAALAELLAVEPEVVGVAEHLLEVEPRLARDRRGATGIPRTRRSTC